MPRLRQPTRDGLSDAFCQATMAWRPEAPEGALKAYLERHGVAHLLGRGRKDDAEARMLTIAFMAAYADAWETVVEPLTAWRMIGLERCEAGYLRIAQGLDPEETPEPTTLNATDTLSSFLGDAGLYHAAAPFAERVLKARERTLGEEPPATLASLNNLASLYE